MKTILHILRDYRREIITLAAVIAVTWLVSTYLFQLTLITGRSMAPTYHNGQFVLVQKQYEPAMGDVAAFQSEKLGIAVIKRIAACPGDTVDICDGCVLVNGIPCDGVYTPPGDLPLPITLAENEYFVLGDNRLLSHDSRYLDFGVLTAEELIGKVLPQRSPAAE